MKKNGVLGVGVATLDIYPGLNRMYPGGNEYNVACNVAKLGMRAGFLGVFADDKAGELLEMTLLAQGVDTAFSHHENGSSGYSLVELKPDGDRIFLDWNKQGVTDLYPVTFTEAELAHAGTYEVVSIGRLSTVTLERQKRLFESGIDILYDFHAAFTDSDIDRIAPYTTYGFFSCSHLPANEIRRTLQRAVEKGCKIAVGTRGCGTVLAWDGVRFYEQPTYPVQAVDALGAGDSYIGAFLAFYLPHPELAQPVRIQYALDAAARHAAHVVTIEGSIGVGYDYMENVVNT